MKQNSIINIFAFICSLWFLLLGWFWAYWINVVFVFPIAIIGYFLWRKGKKQSHNKLNTLTGWLLIAGIIVCFGSLLVWR